MEVMLFGSFVTRSIKKSVLVSLFVLGEPKPFIAPNKNACKCVVGAHVSVNQSN